MPGILHCLLKCGMSKSFDVCIRGDGIVGRTLALLLAQQRLRVAIVSRPTQVSSPDVRAYALNEASRLLLQGLRAWPDARALNSPEVITPVSEMRVWGDQGGRLDFEAPRAEASSALAWIVDVPALEEELGQALRFQPQIERFESADEVKAPLTVICEGQKSSSRDEFGAHWTVKPYAQRAVAARLGADKPHQGVARQWFSAGDVLALLPIGGPAGNSLALVWSVSVSRAQALEQMTADEFAAALMQACGDEAGQLTLKSAVSSWPLALSSADRWVGPGWALAGDAAHTVHPLAGQGLNLGLADAAELAKTLTGREYWRGLGDERLLRRYERARKGDVAAMGAVTDGLHGLFAQSAGQWQVLRNWGMKRVERSGPLKAWLTRQAMGWQKN